MFERHARASLISGWDPPRLAASIVVLAGVGALGNEVAKNLALAGVGRLILCDPDTVAESNLSRTVLFEPADVGRPKVDAAARTLARLAPDVAVLTRQEDLVRGVGLGELADADAVVGCLDSPRARLRLLGRCSLVGAALVDGGTRPWGGEIHLRVDPADPCYGCTLAPADRADSDHPNSCLDLDRRAQPASIVAPTLVAAWMTAAVIQLLLGERPAWRIVDVDAAGGRAEPVAAVRDDSCAYHNPIGRVESVDVSNTATIDQLLSVLPATAEPLGWAVFPQPGVCYHCMQPYDATYRSVDPGIVCVRCGRWSRAALTDRLRDAPGRVPLHELGVAPQEILPVRDGQRGYRWLRLAS